MRKFRGVRGIVMWGTKELEGKELLLGFILGVRFGVPF